MAKRFVLIAAAIFPLALANAGTEMIDNTVQAPAYNYAPAPRPVYYVPPPPPVVVYPAFGYYRPVRVFGGYRHGYVRHGYRAGHYWR